MTLLQPEPSAKAPCTSTMAGLASADEDLRGPGAAPRLTAVAATASRRVAIQDTHFMVLSFPLIRSGTDWRMGVWERTLPRSPSPQPMMLGRVCKLCSDHYTI